MFHPALNLSDTAAPFREWGLYVSVSIAACFRVPLMIDAIVLRSRHVAPFGLFIVHAGNQYLLFRCVVSTLCGQQSNHFLTSFHVSSLARSIVSFQALVIQTFSPLFAVPASGCSGFQ